MKKQKARSSEIAYRVKRTALMCGIKQDSVYKIIRGDRNNEEVLTTYMKLMERDTALLEEVKKDSKMIKILLVDDNADNLMSMEVILEKEGYTFSKALSGKEALKILLKEDDFSLILLDVHMPITDGYKTAELIYQQEKLRHIPIIFITDQEYEYTSVFKGYKTGVVDYISKPVNPQILRSKVDVFAELNKKNQLLQRQGKKLIMINDDLLRLNQDLENRAAELVIADKELVFQNKEKENRAAELIIADKELVFQNKEKENRAAELIIADKELVFQNEEKEKRAAELIIADKELVFQNKEKENRAAELVIANKELAYQNDEKEKRAQELSIANKELAFQNKEKEKRAAELIIANKLAFQNAEKEKRATELIIANKELKKTERAIKESEEKYRTMVEQASDAIFITDTTGRFVTVNTSACKLSQYSEKDLLQMSIYDFAITEDLQKNSFHFDELKQGKVVTTERVIKRKDGIVLHVEITAKLISDGRVLTFVRNISERIQVQNEIIKEKNLSDSIINSLPGVFYLFTREGKYLRWNRNFETVTKYSAEEIEKMHPLDFIDEDEKEMIFQIISNVFISGEDNVQANFLLKTKEKIPYYFTGIAIDYEGNPCLMGVGIDFSERVKAQEKIKETTGQLRQLTAHLQSIREEERKRIGREIHDELGQQLTAIKMDIAWIDKKTPEETIAVKSKLKNIITLLDESNLSIRKILNELMPGILDDHGLLEALQWHGQQFTANTGIPVEFTTAETEVKFSEPIAICIFRVYQESLTNITRYAGANKVLTSLSINDDNIIVTIEDDGKGFNITSVKNKKSFGILGMKERVRSLDGKFELVSSPGKGTKIIITIPRKT